MTSTPRSIQSVTNTELYNRWASVYDTDGNILQAIDDLEFPPLLSQALNHLTRSSPSRPPSTSTPYQLTITELGAGTGRNTSKLLLPLPHISPEVYQINEINALDLSTGMLSIAGKRCTSILSSAAAASPQAAIPKIQFLEFDALRPTAFPEVQKLHGKADLVISTLVLEHLPMDIFFSTAKSLLKDGGILVLTNMHSEMGDMSQAGFVDEETGEKVRGDSYSFKVGEVIEEGMRLGFEVEGQVGERAVAEEDIGEGKLLGPRGKKWIGVKVWFGFVMQLRTSGVA